LGKIGGLRGAFTAERDFAFLEQPLFMAQDHTGPLPADFQAEFAQTCADEAHDYSSGSASFAKTPKSSRVVVSPVTLAPLAISFSSRRMIFPLRVLGRASAKRTSSGFAIAPMCTPTWLRNSLFKSFEASTPVFNVTKATTLCPFNSSGLPTTAASATRA